jgi:hypothetical protein
MRDPGDRNDLHRVPSHRPAKVVLAVALAVGSIFAATASTTPGATAAHKRTLPTKYHKWVKRAHPYRSADGRIIFQPAVG